MRRGHEKDNEEEHNVDHRCDLYDVDFPAISWADKPHAPAPPVGGGAAAGAGAVGRAPGAVILGAAP